MNAQRRRASRSVLRDLRLSAFRNVCGAAALLAAVITSTLVAPKNGAGGQVPSRNFQSANPADASQKLRKDADRFAFPEFWGASGSTSTWKGSMGAGGTALKLNGAAGDFHLGQAIVVDHAGAPPTVGMPTNLSAAATDGLGSTTYKYKIAAIDRECGVSTPSQVMTVTNGVPIRQLGRALASRIVGAERNGTGAIRLNVAASAGFATGATGHVAGLTGQAATGSMPARVGTTEANAEWWTINVVDSTHIDLLGSTFLHPYVSGGVITSYPANVLRWPAVHNAARYAIYNGSTGELVGISSKPYWTDVGNSFSTTETCVPTKAPMAALGQNLYTTVALGVGSPSLQLATAASRSVSDVGVSHNDTPAFARASASFGGNGGKLLLASGKRYPLRQGWAIAPGVSAEGSYLSPALFGTSFPEANRDAPQMNMDALVVDPFYSGAGVTYADGSGLSHLAVLPYGYVFPASNPSSYAGTGILVSQADSVTDNVLIQGFDRCWNAPKQINGVNTVHDRTTVRYLRADCTNAIYMSQSYELSIFEHIEMWPFGTSAYPSASILLVTRAGGTGVQFDGAEENTVADDMESVGHDRGFVFSTSGDIALGSGFWADYNRISGYEFNRINESSGGYFHAVSSGTGFLFSGHAVLQIANMSALASTGDCFQLRDASQIQVASARANRCGHAGLFLGDPNTRFSGSLITQNIGEGPPLFLAASNMAWSQFPTLSAENYDAPGVDGSLPLPAGSTLFAGNSPALPRCVSAATLLLPSNDHYVACEVTGTTHISFVSSVWPGRSVRLYFDESVLISVDGNVVPKGGIAFIARAGSVIDFIGASDGRLHEVGR